MAIDINWVDFGIAFLVLSGVAFGAREGLVRQALFLAALYVSTVLAAQYYAPVGDFISYFFPASDPESRSFVGFALLFLAALAWMNWLSYTAYGSTRINSVANVDKIGGGALGLASALVFAGVVLLALTYGFRADWAGIEPAASFVSNQMDHSSLAATIFSHASFFISTLRPWLPAGLPALLAI